MEESTTSPQINNGGVSKAPVRRGGLGRGLGALIPAAGPPARGATAAQEVAIDAISPNPYQPRVAVDRHRLETLAESIRQHGVIQPLIVSRADDPDRYLLIAGERRWRAARLVGLSTVPIVIKDAAPLAMLELALVENVVRADLTPLEEAAAYRQLIDEFGLTQARIAERVGRSRVSITNTLRLLTAPEPIQTALTEGRLTEGHARALLGLPSAADQIAMLDIVLAKELTVRQTEDAVRKWIAGGGPKPVVTSARDPDDLRLEDRFRRALGTRVVFRRDAGGGGALTIHFSSADELNGLYERLVGQDIW